MEAAPADENALDEQLLEASRLSEAGEDAEALQLLLGLEAANPDHPVLLCMIGALAAQVGAEGMAVDFYRRCLATSPTDPQLLVTAGAGLAAAGDPGAEPALRLAALSAPDLAAARMHYGAYLVRAGLQNEGVEELLAARAIDPDDPEIARELGIAHLLGDRLAESIEELSVAAADPEDPEARLLLGLALIHAGDLSRAAEEVYPLAESLAEDTEAQAILALVFGLEGWEEEAWLALSRAEAARVPLDEAFAREIEQALEAGEEAIRSMLLDEVAPTALRDRTYRS